jgi:hypothetical protein
MTVSCRRSAAEAGAGAALGATETPPGASHAPQPPQNLALA